MLKLLVAYVRAVFAHGRWLGLSLVGLLGDTATVVGNFNVPRWLWYAIIAFGLLAAQFKAYCDVVSQLAAARARLRELDSVETRRAYVDEQIARAAAFRREFEAIPSPVSPSEDRYAWQDTAYVGALIQDVTSWESDVRSALRESLMPGTAQLFDSDEDVGPPSPDSDGRLWASKANCLAYVDRRSSRLRQIAQERLE